ncbi:AAA family ATPase [Novosphingobium beihaiensis]|uniref:AAA family ATPase n=1 Tax=Novosphingobium beihaiensis TaxID=2930389 RepID=A0ABT0BJL3_9SPHN|nr:AAA family ATPase [Novosphingobium beihaiensis]MCJ2185224.1 AAA family ATPase [Novosphingobium beihaiensis]
MSNTFDHMKAARRWLIWQEVRKPGKSKPDKVPFYTDGTPRGATDTPEDTVRLATHDEAWRAAVARGHGWGVGFALGRDATGHFWQGIDLDNITENRLSDLADTLPGYVEKSPSGRGIHAIGYGRQFRSLGSNGTGIEAYSAGRFFTFTGNVIRDGQVVCLADHIEKVLVPLHRKRAGRNRSKSAEPQIEKTISPQVIADLRSALNFLRADSRDLWIAMGHALKELGEAGRELWLSWSQSSKKWQPQDAEKWDSFAPTETGYRAVFAEAQRQGWQNPASGPAQSTRAETNDTGATGHRSLAFRSLDNVPMRAIDWLWPGWIPKGYITLFAGETGAGKSTVLADITARVTSGASWPGEALDASREPGRVLWLGSEDSIEEMTVPRLSACGAELSRIIEIQGVQIDGQRSAFSMQDDLQAVARWLEFSRDEGQPFSMLVIDPVTSYLPGQKLRKVDLNDAGQLRSILEPWLRLAQDFNIAIVCVTHFAKDTTRAMLHRVLGSAAFAQTCRSLCAVIERPAAEGIGADPHAKALVQVKVNLPEHPGGSWKFRTVKVEVGTDPRSGKPIYATRPDWEELDSALTPQTAIGRARGPASKFLSAFGSWLRAYFAEQGGEWHAVADVRSHAIGEIGISESWWDRHSGEFLEKQNAGGKWLCRIPREETCQSGGSGAYVGEVVKLGEVAPLQMDHYPPLAPPCRVSRDAPVPASDDPAW